jgi:branched-chain amino acid aminotransferase
MALTKTEKIWHNGGFISWDDAKTHILSHALHYGSGVFEGIRCYETKKGPAIFRLTDHMRRLMESANLYYMEIPYTQKELEDAAKELVKLNKVKSCYIRPIIFRGYGEMGLNPLNAPVDTSIACWPWGTYLGEEGLKNGIKVIISSIERFNSNILPTRAKATGQYINSILAKIQAVKAGYDEAIMLDNRGLISEGPGENLFIVKDGVITTPPEHASLLMGITRDSAIKIAKDHGLEVVESDIDRGMLYQADEAFFTGTAAEVTPINEIDGHIIGKPGKITKKIQKTFFATVKGELSEYEDWLAYVQ